MNIFIIIGIIAFIALVAVIVFVVYFIFSDSSQKNGQPGSDGYHHTAGGNRTGLNRIFTPGYKRAGIEGERKSSPKSGVKLPEAFFINQGNLWERETESRGQTCRWRFSFGTNGNTTACPFTL